MRNKSIVSTNCRGYLRWGGEREADCYGQKRSQEGGKHSLGVLIIFTASSLWGILAFVQSCWDGNTV